MAVSRKDAAPGETLPDGGDAGLSGQQAAIRQLTEDADGMLRREFGSGRMPGRADRPAYRAFLGSLTN